MGDNDYDNVIDSKHRRFQMLQHFYSAPNFNWTSVLLFRDRSLQLSEMESADLKGFDANSFCNRIIHVAIMVESLDAAHKPLESFLLLFTWTSSFWGHNPILLLRHICLRLTIEAHSPRRYEGTTLSDK